MKDCKCMNCGHGATHHHRKDCSKLPVGFAEEWCDVDGCDCWDYEVYMGGELECLKKVKKVTRNDRLCYEY